MTGPTISDAVVETSRTPEETRAYSRGYAAGRRRADLDFDKVLASEEREQFRRQAALTALNAMIVAGGWGYTKSDGSRHSYMSMREYADAAFEFADILASHSSFTGLSLRARAATGEAK